jgi:hypothetical protein
VGDNIVERFEKPEVTVKIHATIDQHRVQANQISSLRARGRTIQVSRQPRTISNTVVIPDFDTPIRM